MLTATEIDYGEFLLTQDNWNRMVKNHPERTPFLYHQWLRYHSYEVLSGSEKPLILKVGDEKETVAYVPLMSFESKVRRFHARAVGFARSADTFFNNIVARNHYDAILAAVFEYFMSQHTIWDVLLFDKVHEASQLNEAIRRASSTFRLRYDCQSANVNLFVPIDKPWNKYYQSRTKNFRKSIRGLQNRLERSGVITIEKLTNHSKEFKPALEEALKISSKSWKAKENIALSSSAQSVAAFKELCENGIEDVSIVLYILRLNDIPAAAEYHLFYDGIEYALRADYSEEMKSLSPGSFLDYCIIKELFNNGTQRYELGPGLNNYKLRWTNSSYKAHNYRIFNRKVALHVLWHLENSMIPMAKKVRSAFLEKKMPFDQLENAKQKRLFRK